MQVKWSFLPYFIFIAPLENNRWKVKNKTQNTLRKWDFQRSEELVLLVIFCYFKKRNHCIAWENPDFESATFKRYFIACERTSEGNIKFGKWLRTFIRKLTGKFWIWFIQDMWQEHGYVSVNAS